MRSNTGGSSAVIVFRIFWPSWTSVICLEKLQNWSLGPMKLFQRPILRFYPATPPEKRPCKHPVTDHLQSLFPHSLDPVIVEEFRPKVNDTVNDITM